MDLFLNVGLLILTLMKEIKTVFAEKTTVSIIQMNHF